MNRSWNDVQTKATRAATGAEVPPAQALAFGAMAARHLADGGAQDLIHACLDAPDRILSLASRIEEAVEAASVSPRTVRVAATGADAALLISWARSLPCHSDTQKDDSGLTLTLTLTQPSALSRPDRVAVGDALWSAMEALAARTYVPDSDASRALGAGAGLMDTD